MNGWIIGLGLGALALYWMKRQDNTTVVRQPVPFPADITTNPQIAVIAQRQLARLGFSPDNAGMAAFAAQNNLSWDPTGMTDAAMRTLLLAIDTAYAATFH